MTAPNRTPTAADRSWFGEAAESLLPELYGAAVRLCRDRTNAEDLVAETVAKAWRALPSLDDRSVVRAWLFRILNNTFISQRRSVAARAVHESIDGEEAETFSLFEWLHQPILLWWGNPELTLLNRLLREDIERAIDSLPDAFRAVIVMIDVQGLRYTEVAEALNIPIGTVRSRLSRGRGMLQRDLWRHALEAGLTAGPPPSGHNTHREDHE